VRVFLTVKVSFVVKDVILVPQSATFELQDKRFAAVVGKDGKTQNAVITVNDNTVGNFYVVESGLKPGDQIVIEGVANLKEGTQIKTDLQSTDKVYANLKK
jgi:membrane fusion protein (multidrug efflux system)